MAARYRECGLVGLADGRWTRQAGGHPSVTAEVEEAIRAVHEQCLRRSRISMASRERLIHQYVREVFPDSTPLPVKVLDDVFGTPITVHLTIALDAYTHSIVAFRLTPIAESAVEVAMLLRDVLSPLPMRPGWGESMEWPYPGVPATRA
ncbi:hypothetical protein [Streptomyces lydicus]|uniref:hypothetical protein n=1 Tax=Streptomyces lydicus TaxID=47763 RepID=UPI0036EC57C4